MMMQKSPIYLLQVAGVQGQPVVFMLTDSQITDEAFLGDINALLNTGEIMGKQIRTER
jgi:dynein heavy chain